MSKNDGEPKDPIDAARAISEMNPDTQRAFQLVRLERLMQVWWPRAIGSDGGKPDPQALDAVVAVMDAEIKLLGLQEGEDE